MVNLAISSLEGSHQKALLMASLSSLTRTLDKESGLSTLKDTVRQNNEEVEVKFLDVSSDKLNSLMYNAFDIDMFILAVGREDLEPESELDLLLEEVAENVPKASVVLVEDLKRKVSLRSRHQRPLVVKATSPMTRRKSGPSVTEYHVKCNIANPKEVFQFIATLVQESGSESVPSDPLARKKSIRPLENRDESDAIPLLDLRRRSTNVDRQRRIGQVGRPVSCKNKKNSLLPCNCKDLRANSDDVLVSNQIVRMADVCADELLSTEYIRKLRDTKMNLSLLAIILCHPHIILGQSKDPLCGPQCIDTSYVGENFLHILAKKGNIDEIKKLFGGKYGAVGLELVRMETREGYTPLTVAVRMGHTDLATFLIEQLLKASSKDQLEALLLAKNIHGNNLFNSCCRNGKASLLNLFLVHGVSNHLLGCALANPSGTNAQHPGLTPLMYKTVSEEIILKFWPILLAHDARNRVQHRCLKRRSYGHIFAAKNFSSALKLFVRDASKHSEREEGVVKLLSELDNNNNTIFTTAAIHNAKEALILSLGYLIAEGTQEEKEKVMHEKNLHGQTLLEIVLCQKSDLLVPRHMILGIEGELHQNFGQVSKCFRDNLHLQTSSEVHNTLQFMREYLPNDRLAMWREKLLIFLETFFVPFIVMMFDIVTDILLVVSYAYKVLHPGGTFALLQTQATHNLTTFSATATTTVPNSTLPLSYEKRLIYSATFLALPWLFYLIEFLRSPLRQSRTAKLIRKTPENKKTSSLRKCLWVYLLVRSVGLLLFWPIVQLLRKVGLQYDLRILMFLAVGPPTQVRDFKGPRKDCRSAKLGSGAGIDKFSASFI